MTNSTFQSFFKPLFLGLAICTSVLLSPQLLSAQFYTLSIESPEPLEAEYEILLGDFGLQICDFSTLEGELVLSEDSDGSALACSAITNDLSGKIAVIDRGDCGFSAKALQAQLAGAVAVLICNDNDDPIFVMAGGDEADQVTIPTLMIAREDCAAFREEIADGITVSIDRQNPQPLYPEADIVWGDQPGQGDFDGGLNDWTIRTITCGNGPSEFELWRWSDEGLAPNGACSFGEIFSPTKCNGAMIFESDFYDSDGGECGEAVGIGPCPSVQVGELISPSIDLTGSTAEAFSVRFYQDTRQFQSNYWVGWSVDDGATWDSTLVNFDISPNDFNTIDGAVQKVPLTGVDNTVANLRVKFRYEGDYYYWIVDDVQIIEQESNNLRVNRNFFAVPQNAITPISQMEPIRFLADIENIGAATQTNVILNMDVQDADGVSVYTTDLDYGDVPGNTLVENIPFDDTYLPDAMGTYFGRYEVNSDQDDTDSTNNFQEFAFIVSDTTFSKEFGATNLVFPNPDNWDQGAAHAAAYGNYFFVPSSKDADGNNLFVSSISFGIGNADELVGNELAIVLYKWTEDTNNDGQAQPEEREFIDFNSYVIQGTEEPTNVVNIPFPEAGSEPIMLEDNTSYLVMIQYTPPTANPTLDFLIPWSDFIDYGAMIFVNELEGTPRYAPLVGLAGDLTTEDFGTFGFGRNQVPVVRLNIGANTSNERVQVLKNQFVAFPNPTSGQLNLQLALEETAETARVRIFDMSGRLLLQQEFDNVRREQLSFNLGNFANGTYMVELTTDEGSGTRRVIVSH